MKENDNIPVGVRGELEVIVRDCNGNIISYDKDHNEITDWMKHSIIHLLAGNIFSKEYKHIIPDSTPQKHIYTKMQSGVEFHSSTGKINADGMLLTGKSYFHDGIEQTGFGWGNATPLTDTPYICPTYPTKMLFGTGAEFSGDEGFNVITSYYGVSESIDTAESLEKFLGKEMGDITAFNNNIDEPTNYYSNSEVAGALKQCRSVQPKDFTSPDTSSLPPRSETGITGAIKDCLITNETTKDSNYNSKTGMAYSRYRGVGRPCFIYAERENNSFHSVDVNPGNVNINVDSSSTYEDKLTYSVVMPQNNQSEFYPYNGWILKEAGLFSDSILRLGNTISANNYYKMPSGILLAKRYIKPVMKTADTEIEFRWSIYIAESSGQ